MNNYIITVSKSDLWRSNASTLRRSAWDALGRIKQEGLTCLVGPAGKSPGPICPGSDVDWLYAALSRATSESVALKNEQATIVYGQSRARRVIADCRRVFDLKEELTNYRGPGGLTMLHYATLAGNTDLISLLVTDAGISPNIADSFGCTPLHYAAAACDGKFQVVDLLIELGADMGLGNNQGFTPDSSTLSPELSKRQIGAAVASIQGGAAAKAGRRM